LHFKDILVTNYRIFNCTGRKKIKTWPWFAWPPNFRTNSHEICEAPSGRPIVERASLSKMINVGNYP
jgi:hypothetical protein